MHKISRKLRSIFSKTTVRKFDIPIKQCVHYSGFRYGANEYNPYEKYLVDLKNNVPLPVVRQRFIKFLMHYRPRHMGEALGLNHLSKEYPLLKFPWQHFDPRKLADQEGWFSTPNNFNDIRNRFCESGVLSFRIDEEFFWLERALYSISENDYQPELWNSYVRVLQFCRLDGKFAYLLLDGNHRVSAMSTLGYKRVKVEQRSTDIVCEKDSDQWYGVKQGFYSREDALRVFNAYFRSNSSYTTTARPAKIIASDDWLKLYGLI